MGIKMEKTRDSKGRTLEEFLKYYRTRNYAKPSLTADMAVIRKNDNDNAFQILLIRRGGHPFIGQLALPGGFADSDESMETTARRELMEETHVDADLLKSYPVQLIGVYSKPGRDPRGWVVSVAYMIQLDFFEQKAAAGDDAAEAKWFSVTLEPQSVGFSCDSASFSIKYHRSGSALEADECPDLAFDHNQIIIDALHKAQII
jgi:8-oxo-dGTP diphosphatase